MRTFLLAADPQRVRLAEATDRFAEACLLCALRRRAILLLADGVLSLRWFQQFP